MTKDGTDLQACRMCISVVIDAKRAVGVNLCGFIAADDLKQHQQMYCNIFHSYCDHISNVTLYFTGRL